MRHRANKPVVPPNLRNAPSRIRNRLSRISRLGRDDPELAMDSYRNRQVQIAENNAYSQNNNAYSYSDTACAPPVKKNNMVSTGLH